MRLKSRRLVYAAPNDATTAYQYSFYTRAAGLERMRMRCLEVRDDTFQHYTRSFSPDNGRTWSKPEPIRDHWQTPQGMHREYAGPGFVHPQRDRLVTLVLAGELPGDTPLDGMQHWYTVYRVSADGGLTNVVDERVVQEGDYTPEHPCEGVWIGRNSLQVCNAVTSTADGRLLAPVQITPLGPDGRYYNPAGAYTYTDAAVLIGTWTEGDRIRWDLSQRVAADPERSTRGMIEPTVAEMPDGRILMVLRGSNDRRTELPGHKWHSVSSDGGRRWTPPEPWRYSDGTAFFSPSSISIMIRHSSGRYLWVGNICPENPQSNSPRYPLVIAEVDPHSLMLVRESVAQVDTRRPGEHPSMSLSNFSVEEDREAGDVRIHMTRMYATAAGATGHSYVYRIAT